MRATPTPLSGARMQRQAVLPASTAPQLNAAAAAAPAARRGRLLLQAAASCCSASTTLLAATQTKYASCRSRRLAGRARAAAGPGGAPPPPPPPGLSEEERAAVRAGVERAASTLNEIVEEVSREVFLSEAAAYVTAEAADSALSDAVRGAVARRLEWLDANFLAAVNAYTEVARRQGNDVLVEILGLLRDEVLAQVTLRLPPSVQALDAALQLDRSSERLKVLRTALAGGGGEVPGVDMESLSATANQFVDDMEDQEIVADRALLARLVLVREELRALYYTSKQEEEGRGFMGPTTDRGATASSSDSGSSSGSGSTALVKATDAPRGGRLYGPDAPAAAPGVVGTAEEAEAEARSAAAAAPAAAAAAAAAAPAGGSAAAGDGEKDSLSAIAAASSAAAANDGGFFSFHRSNLPRRCAAFVQALMAVGDPPRRVALLRKAFAEDWDGAGGSAKEPGKVATGEAGDTGDTGDAQESPDVVRPGRLLASIHALRREMLLQQEANGGAAGAAGGGSGAGGKEPNVAEALGYAPLLRRLDDIQLEAVLVLHEMQKGKGLRGSGDGGGGAKPAVAAGGGSGGKGSGDVSRR